MNVKILSLNISEFGALSSFKLSFEDSLNIIQGDNESGKSTLLLFISYMLYGINKTARAGSPNKYDKDRSLNWTSLRAAGSMELECDGVRYRIERSNVRKSANSEATVTDLETGERVFAGIEPGEAFFGVSKKTFESCLWCAQSRASAINGESVSQTLSNLSLTADESINGDALLAVIREAKKQYKHERGEGGKIYEVSLKISAAKERAREIDLLLEKNASASAEGERLALELEIAKEKLRSAEYEVNAANAKAILSRFDELHEVEAEMERNKTELEVLTNISLLNKRSPDTTELADLKLLSRSFKAKHSELESARVKSSSFQVNADMSAVRIADKLSKNGSEQEFLERIRKKEASLKLMPLVCAAALVFAIMLSITVSFLMSSIILAAPILAVFAVGITVYSVLSLKQKKQLTSELLELGTTPGEYRSYLNYCFSQKKLFIAQNEVVERNSLEVERISRELAELTERIKAKLIEYQREAGDADEFDRLIWDIENYLRESSTLKGKVSIGEQLVDKYKTSLKKYDEPALRDLLPKDREVSDEGLAEAQYNAAKENVKALEKKLTDIKLILASIGVSPDDKADLLLEIESLEAERLALEERFEILCTAYSAIDTAYTNMRRNFAPKIRESAGELIGGISNGKYSNLFIDEDFEINVEYEGMKRSSALMSAGTADAIYLSLRLSLIENIFEGNVPFFMDETLSQLDDNRARGALGIISQFIRKGNQCILFTCHKRERELCDSLGIKYNYININKQ